MLKVRVEKFPENLTKEQIHELFKDYEVDKVDESLKSVDLTLKSEK